MNLKIITIIMRLCLIYITHAQFIPSTSKIEWTPGVPGGIPDSVFPVFNVLNYGADNTGETDSYQSIIDAIVAVPVTGGIVYIPEGNYRIESKITISKNNVIIRGDGMNKTKLFMHFSDDCFEIVTYRHGEWQNLISGYDFNSNTVNVENGSLFTIGEFTEIQQKNDSGIMYTDTKWIQDWSENSVAQLFEIENINGNELTFKTSLHYKFDSIQNPVIRPQNFIRNVGFEDFYIEKMEAEGHTFEFINAAYCWIKGVESYHTRKAHIHINTSIGIEARECFIHRSFHYGGGGSGYGVDCSYHATDCLIENNVFDSLRHAMLVQLGANGNVFGYNYSLHPVQGDGETNLNQGWIPPDISVHGHYPYMNLFEGNDVNEIGISDYWGPVGINTYFRNEVNDEGIIYYDHSHFQNVIGNVTTEIQNSDSTDKYILEHGNIVNSALQWNDTIAGHNLPDSYYLDSKPSFFDKRNWPVYGPDTESENLLPAQIWFENKEKKCLFFNKIKLNQIILNIFLLNLF